MKYKFTIEGRLPSLNEFISAERTQFRTRYGGFMTRGAKMKKDCQKQIIQYIRRDIPNVKIEEPVVIHYKFYEQNRKRDCGNVFSTADKFIEDALQETGTIINDNQKYVKGFTSEFFVDQNNPRIEVELETFTEYQERKNLIQKILEIWKKG